MKISIFVYCLAAVLQISFSFQAALSDCTNMYFYKKCIFLVIIWTLFFCFFFSNILTVMKKPMQRICENMKHGFWLMCSSHRRQNLQKNPQTSMRFWWNECEKTVPFEALQLRHTSYWKCHSQFKWVSEN